MTLRILKRKIVLGTAQFGLLYGINNKTGKPDQHVVSEILDYAWEQDIRLLDSAEAYGDSLKVIGSYIGGKKTKNFEIISKFIGVEGSKNSPGDGLMNLPVDHLYGYLYHRYEDYKSGQYQNELLALKAEKKIHRIGVSLYGLKELESVIVDPAIDIIQIPFNPFDSTREKKELLRDAKNNGKEIHVRSVFLQGLLFKEPSELTGNLIPLAKPLQEFKQKVHEHDLNIRQACLNYALYQPFIDYVIIGIETVEQLQQNLSSIIDALPEALCEWVPNVPPKDTMLLNPTNWRL